MRDHAHPVPGLLVLLVLTAAAGCGIVDAPPGDTPGPGSPTPASRSPSPRRTLPTAPPTTAAGGTPHVVRYDIGGSVPANLSYASVDAAGTSSTVRLTGV